MPAENRDVRGNEIEPALIRTPELTGKITAGESITNLVGEGLSISSGALQSRDAHRDAHRYLWVTGGRDRNGDHYGRTFVYSFESDSWRELPEMPTPRRTGGAAIVDGVLYYIGGLDASDSVTTAVEAFDMATGQWSTKTAMPTARGRLSHELLPIDGKLHAIGGYLSDGSRAVAHEVYDPEADTWDTAPADMPTDQSFPLQAHHDGYLWALTGNRDGGDGGHIQRYDLDNDNWDGMSNFSAHPDFVTDGTAAQDGSIVYVVGGWDTSTTNKTRLDAAYSYDLETDNWTQESTLPQVWSHGFIVRDDRTGRLYRAMGDKFPNSGTADHPAGRTAELQAMSFDADEYVKLSDAPIALQNCAGVISQDGPAAGVGHGFAQDHPVDVLTFDSGRLHETFAGNTGQASIISTDYVVDGGHALKLASDGTLMEIHSTGGLPVTIQRGDRFRYRVNNVNANFSYFNFAQQPGAEQSDYYRITLNAQDEFHIHEFSGGTKSTVASDTSTGLTTGFDRLFDVDGWMKPNGDLQAVLYGTDGETQITSISGTPSNVYDEGHLGFAVHSDAAGEYAVFDSVRK